MALEDILQLSFTTVFAAAAVAAKHRIAQVRTNKLRDKMYATETNDNNKKYNTVNRRTLTQACNEMAAYPGAGCCHALLKSQACIGVLLTIISLRLLLLRAAHKGMQLVTPLLPQRKQCCCQDLLFRDGACAPYDPH